MASGTHALTGSEGHMSSCYQVIVEMVRAEPLPDEQLEDLAEACLDALNRRTRLVALGPVVSVDFAKSSLEIEFTVGGDTVEDVNEKIEHVARVVSETLSKNDSEDAFAYAGSRTERVAAVAG
jgi:hypothetical protein